MNNVLLFFIIGFMAAFIGFVAGYFFGDKLSAQYEYNHNPELRSLLTRAANSKTVHRDLLDGDR